MTVVKAIVGNDASELVSSESNTAPKVKASARPSDIVSSVALVPNAPVVAPATLTTLDKLVVFNLAEIDVFNSVAVNLTLAPFPKLVLSDIVIVAVPVPEIVDSASTISP